MKQIFIFLILILFSLNLPAQQPCGIDEHDIELITQRLLKHKKTLREGNIPAKSGSITYVPVKFHIMGNASGNLGVREENLLQQIALLNDGFRPYEIQFYIDSGFNYINNTNAFQNPSSNAGLIVLGNNKLNGRMNIYIPQNASTGGGSIGTTLGFYSPFNDWIVIRQQEVNFLTSTLTHEVGHFLGLLHPHSGWDAEVFDPMIHTPTPETSPGGRPTENQARTGPCRNCNTAGDLLCDTPPDYNFGFGWNDCNYNVGTLDPCGEVVDPQETNFMGYFLECPIDSYVFTDDQVEIMNLDIAARRNNNTIFSSLGPTIVDPVQGDIVVKTPEPDGFSAPSSSGGVWFSWEPVEGATDYIFEYSRKLGGFSGGGRVMITNSEAGVLIDEPFLPNTEYQWRIYPYNQSSTGYGFSETFFFTTSPAVSVAQIEEVESFEIIPSLVSNQDQVLLSINSTQSIDVDVQLVDISGRLLSNHRNNLITGENNIDLSVSGLSNGVYFVKLQSDTGIITKRFIVQGN